MVGAREEPMKQPKGNIKLADRLQEIEWDINDIVIIKGIKLQILSRSACQKIADFIEGGQDG